ncbi:uncharacterized protein LOC128721346 [Anopheles nili]|uniref:uncharacterized protein LOC128721346 n=1 Tax=Anopheles nili TaxID=185578 RepID=UPI00237B600F|nr:uncharacterized protein LOC128721346 [Anopheles nili]
MLYRGTAARIGWLCLAVLAALVATVFGGRHSFRQLCITESQQRGRCVPVKQCDSVLVTLRKDSLTNEDIQFLYSTECGRTPEGKALVCCVQSSLIPVESTISSSNRVSEPETATTPAAVGTRECGVQFNVELRSANYSIGHHPWTVLLHYGNQPHESRFICGGTLISTQYVLTSASCVDEADTWNNLTVRFGEWDLESAIDCILTPEGNDVLCADPSYDVLVSRVILHEAYDGRRNDLALLRLSRPVEITDWVAPICLPESPVVNETLTHYASGWNQNTCEDNVSRFKLLSSYRVTNQTDCQRHVPSVAGTSYNFVCASSLEQAYGDTGAGLTVARSIGTTKTTYELIGVLSSLTNCANFNGVAVYTKVGQYLDWIENQLQLAAAHGYSSILVRSPPIMRSVYCTPQSSGSNLRFCSTDNLFSTGPLAAGGVATVGETVLVGLSGCWQQTSALRSITPQRLLSRKRTSFVVSSGLLSSCRTSGHWATITQVCCAGVKEKEETTLPEPPNCGIQLSDRLIGGQPTKIDEFPWTALIEYQKPNGQFGFHCGGSIINERYVLTAGHCINAIPKTWKPYRVRLGEWDLASANDKEDDFSSNAPIDLDIEKIIVHADYDPRDKSNVNDIALIRFTRTVHYSETIRPICLPLADSVRNRNHAGTSSYAAGWGKTETATASEKKLKVELTIKSLQECSPVYQRSGIKLTQGQMCAGGVRDKDTCSGDSGGPLMRQLAGTWYLVGVKPVSNQRPSNYNEMLPGIVTAARWGLLLICFQLIAAQRVSALLPGQSCVSPNREPGKCVLFQECPSLVALYNNQFSTADDVQFLKQSQCGVLQKKVLVCCAVSKQKASLPESPKCGVQLSDRLYGGQPTALDEFPWTALIEFQKPDGSFGFHCGGSLINQRYIVTAAHCIDAIPRGWKVHRVRLGEWDLASATDCQNGLCSNAPIDLDIEKIEVHSNYDSRDQSNANDIALIRFTRDVSYSETIRPICLPLSTSIRSRNHVGLSSFAAGWGKTESASASDKKLKVELNIKSLQDCTSIYQRGGINLKSTHMCAGGVRGKDTCSGDSGGPLMRQLAGTWYLLGVVSFGPQKCGTAGVPGVYTNVAEYVDWIKDHIY